MTTFDKMHVNTAGMRYVGPGHYYGKIIIDAAEIYPGTFEVMAMRPDGEEIEAETVHSVAEAQVSYNRLLSYHVFGLSDGMYTMADWGKDGTFKAKVGQEVSGEIYDQMLNALPPRRLPAVLRASGYSGFAMGEPTDNDPETGFFRYLTFVKRNGRFYYAGLYTC